MELFKHFKNTYYKNSKLSDGRDRLVFVDWFRNQSEVISYFPCLNVVHADQSGFRQNAINWINIKGFNSV